MKMNAMPQSPPSQAHHGTCRVAGLRSDPVTACSSPASTRKQVPMVKLSQVVAIALPVSAPTRPLVACCTVISAPTKAATRAGTTTDWPAPPPRALTATTTPTKARAADAARAGVTGALPAGPSPSLSTRRALPVCPPTTAMVKMATPASGTA